MASSRFLLRSSSLLGRHRAHHTLTTMTTSPPRLMLPPAFDSQGKHMTYQMYNLSEDRVESPITRRISSSSSSSSKEAELGIKVVGSSHGWLSLFNPRTNNLFLSNPLTRQHINLPPLTTLLDNDKNKNNKLDQQGFTVSKLILSGPPYDDECRALMSFGFNSLPNRLACCVPGENKSKSPHWTLLSELNHKVEDEIEYNSDSDDQDYSETQLGTCYYDFVYSPTHKLFFCITDYNHLQSLDLEYLCFPNIRVSGFIQGLSGEYDRFEHEFGYRTKPYAKLEKYLVLDDRSDQLFLVRRPIRARVRHGDDGHSFTRTVYYGYRRGWCDSYPYKTMGFDVHKIDDSVIKWRKRKVRATYVPPGGGSLDGLAMFVGLNQSFALHADEFPELKPNSIYFTDSLNDASTTSARGDFHEDVPRPPKSIDRAYGGHDLGVFSYEDKTFSPCYYPCDVESIKRISPPPFWFNTS